MKTAITSLLVGFLFAIGLGISGMTQPARVVSFLDLFGEWNPSLLFVMIGALAVHTILFRLITKRSSPIFSDKFQIPKRKDVDAKLLVGSALFGIGWGLVGYCPAPAIVATATFTQAPIIFVTSLLIGMLLYRFQEHLRSQSTSL